MTTDLERRNQTAQETRGKQREAWIIGGLAVVGLTVVAIIKPGIITGAFASPRALGVFAAAGAIFLALCVLVRRLPNAAARILLLLVPVALVAWFAVLPSLVRTTANEPLPVAAAEPASADPATAPAVAVPETGAAAPTDALPT